MKKIFYFPLLMLIFFTQNLMAQNSVVGSYHISSGNPDDGGYNWFLFENKEFAMLTFGQIISGTYRMVTENEIEFTPFAPDQSFQVFGRNNSLIKGAQILFSGSDINENAYIATSKKEINPILNVDSNCLPPTILKTYENPIETLILSNCLLDDECEKKFSLEFALQNNNDFIVFYYNSQTKIASFQGKIENNQLSILRSSKESSPKKSILKRDEVEIGKYVQKQKRNYAADSLILDKNNHSVYLSTSPIYDEEERQLNSNDYTFNTATGIYTAKIAASDSNNFSSEFDQLYLYKKLNYQPYAVPIQLGKKSLFNYKCD